MNLGKVALGVAGGYMLGRFRKTRWLALAAALVASKRIGGEIAQRGNAALESSPELKNLAEQGRETASALVGRRIHGVNDRLRSLTESLRGPLEASGDGQQDAHSSDDDDGGQDNQQEDQTARAAQNASQQDSDQPNSEQQDAGQQDSGQQDQAAQKSADKPARSSSARKQPAGVSGRPRSGR